MADSLEQWGYTVHFIDDGDQFNSSDLSIYEGMIGIFISEVVNSSDIVAFGAEAINAHNYAVPCVNTEGYALRTDRWNWINSNTDDFHQASDGVADEQIIVIKDNTH